VQGSVDIELDADPEKQQRIFEHYLEQTEEAVARHPGVDLIVWPETVYGGFLYGADARPAVPRDWQFSDREFHQRLEEAIVGSREGLARLAAHFHAPMLVGVETLYFGRDRLHWYNSAAYVARASAGADAFEVAGRYDKMHLVMFGEYVPLADRFPWLQDVTPLSTSTTPGARPAAFDVRGLRLAPNICYETVMPQVIRQQVNALAQEGREPDVLVNLTNDGWFWGSSELDMHLICGVFRAVECRKPLLIAANTGFSAWIDAGGRIRAQGPRRQTGLIVAQVRADPRRSWYLYYGDWPAGICLVACGALAVAGAVGKWGRVFRALASRAIRS